VLNPHHQVSCEPPKIEEMVQIRSIYQVIHALREMAKREDCLTSVVCSLAKCERVLNLRGKWHVNNEASASLSEIRYPRCIPITTFVSSALLLSQSQPGAAVSRPDSPCPLADVMSAVLAKWEMMLHRLHGKPQDSNSSPADDTG
jgi:hypothetical protein